MKLKKFAYLYLKPLGNLILKILKKNPGNLLKNLEKSWLNIMEFCQSEKVVTLIIDHNINGNRNRGLVINNSKFVTTNEHECQSKLPPFN